MDYDLWVDFQRMGDDGRLLARARNARPGFTITAGMYLVVGCEDARPAVARILTVTAEGSSNSKCSPDPSTFTAISCPPGRYTEAVRELSIDERLVLSNAAANARLEGQELPEEDEELAAAYLAGEIDAATYQQRIRELVTGIAAARARTA